MAEDISANPKDTGMILGIVACVLAVLGILSLGFVFIPLAALTSLITTVIVIRNKTINGIVILVLAWILTVAGLFLSPVLLMFIEGLFSLGAECATL